MPSAPGVHVELDPAGAVPERIGTSSETITVRGLETLGRKPGAVRGDDESCDTRRSPPPGAAPGWSCPTWGLLKRQCEHTRMPVDDKGVRATTNVLALRETFQIARGAADEETVVVLELERDGIVALRRGRAGGLLGRDAGGDRAARWRPTAPALIGDDRSRGRSGAGTLAGTARRARRWRWTARCTTGSAVASGQPHWRLLGADAVDAADLVHDRDRLVEGTADRTRAGGRLRGAEDQGRRAGDLERLRAVRAATDARLRIDGNEGWDLETARDADPGAAGDRRGVRRAALPSRRPRLVPRVPRAARALAGDDRRGMQGPRRRSRRSRRTPTGS